jgi:hypothetical protein
MDASGIAAGVRRLRDDAACRETLIRRGHEQAARFTWEAGGRQLRVLLEGLVARPRSAGV